MTMKPLPTYDELFAENDRLRTLVGRLAALLKAREFHGAWNKCDTCLAQNWNVRRHDPDCELAAALREAGIECEVENGNG